MPAVHIDVIPSTPAPASAPVAHPLSCDAGRDQTLAQGAGAIGLVPAPAAFQPQLLVSWAAQGLSASPAAGLGHSAGGVCLSWLWLLEQRWLLPCCPVQGVPQLGCCRGLLTAWVPALPSSASPGVLPWCPAQSACHAAQLFWAWATWPQSHFSVEPKGVWCLAGAGGQQEATQLTVLPAAQDTPKQGSVHLPALIQHSELCQSGTAKLRRVNVTLLPGLQLSVFLIFSLAALQTQPLSSVPFTLPCQFTRSALLAASCVPKCSAEPALSLRQELFS